ncbi:MAG: hypothetical protein A2Y17_05635 [Clostridiales bacterium GWF2_38_85]|nr:MAG: hypothetical protein A2Y17_05635 [Clostridiales bacterium GWF2_38_85]HBL84037.1 magnesium chelatase [Clostridiales bacterium]
MVSTVYSAALNGIDAFIVSVEASHISRNTDGNNNEIYIIGLPDAAVRESIGRVRSAAASAGYRLPGGNSTINLAPADRKKEGSAFDLPIFLSLIKNDILEKIDLSDKCFLGELSLTGAIRPVKGALSMAIAARNTGIKELYLPAENADEASAAEGIDVFPAGNLVELYEHLMGIKLIQPKVFSFDKLKFETSMLGLDYADVKGQENAKKALEVAAAGSHNMLMIGPPGSGKSMLASRLPSILPELTLDEAIETTQIHSIAGTLPHNTSLILTRPFRAPHHTLSAAGLSGGGRIPIPGEISIAHNGVLFLDELPEFDKNIIEVLRQPLEERKVTITRVNGKFTFPASFMMVCAMNPCRCGYYGSTQKQCTCSPMARHTYLAKISGPLLDRIDIQIEVPALDYDKLSSIRPAESSAEIRKRVVAARSFALERFKDETVNGSPLLCNGMMQSVHIRKFCSLDDSGKQIMKTAFSKLGLSARGYDRILRLSRTLADFDKSETIKKEHILIAIQMRSLDRKYWE